jgi:hypothetical protein
MVPGKQIFNDGIIYFSFFFEHFQDLVSKGLFEIFGNKNCLFQDLNEIRSDDDRIICDQRQIKVSGGSGNQPVM